ncbi:unannotated protein [freshwater metagenome]|uniref:Unannotated protein n=1 Tax=freshwater metagenome TaxID=449393 RepID=A0A6J7P7Y7_9ZZZZ
MTSPVIPITKKLMTIVTRPNFIVGRAISTSFFFNKSHAEIPATNAPAVKAAEGIV